MPGSFERMLVSKLDAIRSKPRGVRQMYAVWIAGAATSCVAAVWIVAIVFAGYYTGFTSSDKEQLASAKQSSQDSLTAFKNEFADQLKNSPAREQVNQLLEQFKQQKEQQTAAALGITATSSVPSSVPDTATATTSTENTDPYGTNY